MEDLMISLFDEEWYLLSATDLVIYLMAHSLVVAVVTSTDQIQILITFIHRYVRHILQSLRGFADVCKAIRS